jgi:hypothetical protein
MNPIKPIAVKSFAGHEIAGPRELVFRVLEDGFCLDCIWCYDNGSDLPCNDEFVCHGEAQGFDAKGEHESYYSKRIYELGGKDGHEPVLRRTK